MSGDNWQVIIVALIAGLPATLVALAGLIKTTHVEKSINGRMRELIEGKEQIAESKGRATGQAQGHREGVVDEKLRAHGLEEATRTRDSGLKGNRRIIRGDSGTDL